MTALTDAQRTMLRNIIEHQDPLRGIRGMAAHGGASQTFSALQRKGLLHGDQPTEAAYLVAVESGWITWDQVPT